MKTQIFLKWSYGLALAMLSFAVCGQKPTNSSPALSYDQPAIANEPLTNAPPPEQTEQDLENAPGQIVSAAKMPTALNLSAPAAEIVKLAQAGVDESVMMAYVTNSTYVFKLTSDDIIYLNDVGVSGPVITAMLQRDQMVKATMPYAGVVAPVTYSSQPVPASGAPVPYATSQDTEAQPPAPEVVENVQPAQPANVSYTYFYDSLAPYGNWVNIAGYGLCWQPTVVAGNRGWQPYCDRGRWVYSDCGWYWASDYSWGWAPFHYGRWFQHNRWGWCWAPDTVWGPSWVSWRYTSAYCGWAPLPPTACYAPGIGFTYYGRSVGVNFSFGLTARHYAFVPVSDFCNRQPNHYRLPGNNVTQIYNTTVAVNQYDRGSHNRIINHGIPVDRVRSATHTEIHPVKIHDAGQPVDARFQHQERQANRTLTVYRPSLPQPQGTPRLVGEGVKPAPRQNFARRNDLTPPANNTLAPATARSPFGAANSAPPAGRAQTAPTARNERIGTAPNETWFNNSYRGPETSPSAGTTAPLILRGPNQQNAPRTRELMQPPAAPVSQITAPATPVQNNPPVMTPHWYQPAAQAAQPAPTAPTAPPAAPAQNNFRNTPGQRILMTPSRQMQPVAPVQNQQRFIQPAMPVQQQQTVPQFQTPRAAEMHMQQPRFNSSFNSAVPPAAPRVDVRPAPPMPMAPAVQPNTSNSRNSRQDFSDAGRLR